MSTSILQVSLSGNTGGSSSSGSASGEFKAPELERKLSDLAESLSGFKTALNEFKSVTKAQSNDSKQQHQKYVEEQRTTRTQLQKDKASVTASVQTNPDVINQRKMQAESAKYSNLASLQRNQNAKELLQIGKQSIASGDTKWGKQLIDKVADATAKGASKGLGNSGLWKTILAGGAAIGIDKLAKSYAQTTTAMGQQILQNPIQNGYDIGGTTSQFNLSNTQRQFGYAEAGLTAAGAAVGGIFGGKYGAGIGAAVGGTAAGILSSVGMTNATLQAQVGGDVINNKMRLESMRASNRPAYEATVATQGNRPQSDIEIPLIQTIAKSISVYNKNTEAVSKLGKSILDFSKATQLDMGTTASIASSAGYLSRQKGFNFENTKSLFAANGTTDYAGALGNAVGLAQAGFSVQKAQEIAIKYQSTNPGFQQSSSGYYGNTMQRDIASLQTKAIAGFNPEDLFDPTAKNHSAAYKRARALADIAIKNPGTAQSILAETKLQAIGGSTSIPLSDFQNTKPIGAIGVTGKQSAIYNEINKDRGLALSNDLSAGDAGKKLSELVNGIQAVSAATNPVVKGFNDLTSALSSMYKTLMGGSNNGYNSNGAGSSQSKNH